MEYPINKGVGRSFEFKGLQTIYVFIALGGIVIGVLLYFILGLFLPFEISIIVVAIVAIGCVGAAYYLNGKYGETGLLMERGARKLHQRIQNDRRVRSLIIRKGDEF